MSYVIIVIEEAISNLKNTTKYIFIVLVHIIFSITCINTTLNVFPL